MSGRRRDGRQDVWLVVNQASGSNDAAAVEDLKRSFADAAWPVRRTLCCPADAMPSPAELEAADDPLVAVFTGDGTANACAAALRGWRGRLLVLPGGTQNLLSRRLHGEADATEIVRRIARDAVRAIRLSTVHCAAGHALVDLLVGPGASWNKVREAMREGSLPGIASEAGAALRETTGGTGVRCADPPLGSRDGYPLVKLTPSHRGIQVDAYHAENLRDFLAQGWALLKRDFRQGPHDRLGLVDRLAMDKQDGGGLDILLDGEPHRLPPRADFTVAEFELDFLATHHGY